MPTVKFFATLRQMTGERQTVVPGVTVREVLDNLAGMYEGKLERYLKVSIVLVNNKNIRYLRGDRTRLKPEDVVSIYPPLGGG
jgi:molybdopterin synthase sulfur carrier subunit